MLLIGYIFGFLVAVTCADTELSKRFDRLPIQMDVGATKHIVICTGLKRSSSCREGSRIAVTYAFWGRTSDKICPSDDGDPVTDCDSAEETESLVKLYCEGKDQCELEARHQYLQKNGTHHCPGVNKYLIMNYTCIPESKGVVLCDSEHTTLECKAGWRILITEAFWGRRASARYCGTADNAMECEGNEFASKFLKAKCNGLTQCSIRAASEDLDDVAKSNCPGLLKYLMVNYACLPKEKIKGVDSESKSADDENESNVENKLLADTSSKELVDLLEKHLNELPPHKTEARASSSKTDLNGASSTRTGTLAPTKVTLTKDASKSSSSSGSVHQDTKPQSHSMSTKKANSKYSSDSQEVKFGSSSQFIKMPLKDDRDDKESPAMDLQATETSKKSQENVPAGSTLQAKGDIPHTSIEDTQEEGPAPYEVTEPASVKSILARAKEVLKTLDDDKDENTVAMPSNSTKKSVIFKKSKSTTTTEDAKKVKEVAKLAQSLARTAKARRTHWEQKNNQDKSADEEEGSTRSSSSSSSSKKPQPGQQKTGLGATGPGTAGIGNTP